MIKKLIVSTVVGSLLIFLSAVNSSIHAQTQDKTLNHTSSETQQTNDNKPAGNMSPRVVLPGEDRHQIENTQTGHYQSIGYIEAGESIATGVVIGENTILTNKHVADLSNGNLSFAPAAENDSQFPYGTFSEKDTQAYPGDADLVLVHLNKNDDGQSVGEVVEPATIQDASTVSKDNPITVTGYPGDKPLATMWESSGEIINGNSETLTYNASTYGGNSGSPVFNSNNELIGLHYGGVEGESNSAVPLTGDILQFINNNNS
ncbi:trypsin-like serine peptidase [Staphylococcus nepalensis]|uniref:trypsin-like serine peptidase n=1 Tax=Staphylococcus nepalensis TaxID=214473 RepID=UPI000E04FF38|nr:serine protease [Staphylococcus nepalensis]MDR5649281.1 serine protease [Staphylococcus nepalensis]SUM66713.1 glutamyl endopeptidase precursor [Staphylococcus nepalensis]SUM94650.1 glutamyl endopeptidase precursor [Staphylococcus nepalensis]